MGNPIDYCLTLTGPVNEVDGRNQGYKSQSAQYSGPTGNPSLPDWRVWSAAGYGQRIQNMLNSVGGGYSFKVQDFGRIVVVTGTYNCAATGNAVSKTFAIFFDNQKKGDGLVFTTSTKWRSVTTADQAASYIRSILSSLSYKAKQS